MGDSGYIHYVVLLTRHGFAPYRDIVEINTPGAYLTEHFAMNMFGTGALGWRFFDFSLLAITFASYFRILRARGLAAAVIAGTLFLAIHGQDGVMMSGERDLTAAVLQVAAIALLLMASEAGAAAALRAGAARLSFAFLTGLLLSWSACIKPPNVILLTAVLVWIVIVPARQLRLPLLVSALVGSVIPWLVCFVYLLRYHAVRAFWANLHGLEAYHVSLDRRPLTYLLPHAFSPILWLVVLALPLAFRSRSRITATESLLLLAGVAGLLSYVMQDKGFSYQRYPFLIFLIPLIVLWFADPASGAVWRDALRAAILLAILGSICLMVYKASTYSHTDPDIALMADLQRLGATKASGSIQCLDTAGGCIQTLYKTRLVQSTGFIYDCYFEDSRNATVRNLRSSFEAEMEEKRPAWIIETDSSCYDHARTFNKYPDWAELNNDLSNGYTMVLQREPTEPRRYWSRSQVPYAYRIYKRR